MSDPDAKYVCPLILTIAKLQILALCSFKVETTLPSLDTTEIEPSLRPNADIWLLIFIPHKTSCEPGTSTFVAPVRFTF